VIGCVYEYVPGAARVALEDSERGRNMDTQTHELLHVLHYCHFNRGNRPDGDGGHLDTVWALLYDAAGLAALRAESAGA
jgi:hypothetical protein